MTGEVVFTLPTLDDDFEWMWEKERRLLLGKHRPRKKAGGRCTLCFISIAKSSLLMTSFFYLLNEIRKFYKKIKKISFLKSALKTIFLTFKLKTLSRQHKSDVGCGLAFLKLQNFQAKFGRIRWASVNWRQRLLIQCWRSPLTSKNFIAFQTPMKY